MAVAVEEIFVLVVAAGVTVLLFAVLLSIRQKARINSLDTRASIDPQLRASMPAWMQAAVVSHLDDTLETREIVRRVVRDKNFEHAEEDLKALKKMA